MPPWQHDYPRGEVHFTRILNEITYMRPRLDGSTMLLLALAVAGLLGVTFLQRARPAAQ